MLSRLSIATMAVAILHAWTALHLVSGDVPVSLCRSFCGNITVDYPFALRPGCGHPALRDLLFCINGVLMLHILSGSYRVLDIDYAYRALTLHDPGMSDCYSIRRSDDRTTLTRGNGFVVEAWRAPYMEPAPDNVFMLLGCRAESPLFQGFPGRHLPCRNVSGMGCDDYYACPAWEVRPRSGASAYGAQTPPECCSVPFGAIRAINLTRLGCQGYSSAYALAPLQPRGPGEWYYGIRVSYSLPTDHQDFCRACQATGGLCGFDTLGTGQLCLCEGWNSTSNCDSVDSLAMSVDLTSSLVSLFGGLLIYMVAWMPSLQKPSYLSLLFYDF